jgi:Ca2+-binding RTX toxin-like protein
MSLEGETRMAAPSGIRLNGTSLASTGPHLALTRDPLAGERIGTLSAVDADAGDRFTFELLDDAGGLFFLTGNLLRRAAGGVLDPALGSHTLRVRVTDSTGGTFEADAVVDVAALPNVVRADGTAGDDTLTSNVGAEFFLATAGDDRIETDGSDIVVYSGRREDYAFVYTPGESGYGGYGSGEATPDTLSVTDLRPGGPDGADLIINPSRLRFADGDVTAGNIRDGQPALTVTGQNLDFDVYAPEHEAAGFVIGTLSALGLPPGGSITVTGFDVLSFVNESGPPVTALTTLFTIDEQLRIVTTAPLDFETHHLHFVRVDFQDGAGNSFSDSIRIDVLDRPDAPHAASLRQVLPGGELGGPARVAKHDNRSGHVEVGRLVFSDVDGAALGYSIRLASEFTSDFFLVGDRLFLRRGKLINFETGTFHSVDVIVRDLEMRPDQEVRLSALFEVFLGPVEGTAGADVIGGTAGDDVIFGRAGDDRLLGGLGNDTLIGGLGADLLRGGEGDDLLVADSLIAETALRWTDLAPPGASLVPGFEQNIGALNVTVAVETFTDGSAVVSGAAIFVDVGEPFAPNSMYFTTGGAGPTSRLTLRFTDAAGEAEVENILFRLLDLDAGGHQDIVTVTAFDATGAAVEVLLTPNGEDSIVGNTVTGADIGNDFTSATGSILVRIPGPVHEFHVFYENGRPGGQVLGISDIHFLPPNATAPGSRLLGEAGQDTLIGGVGADTLDGGAGADRMEGGRGNDRYVVDDPGDVVIERANGGVDLVRASVDHVLGEHVEHLTLTGAAATSGTGNALANRIIGNGAANILRGEGGNDRLRGGLGADTLFGGDGSDLFLYADVAESSVAAPDLIADFVHIRGGERDRVDLREMDADTGTAGNQAFSFIGDRAFGSVAGELRVETAGAGLFRVEGDVNGDGAADFAILIQSANTPAAAWFLL